MIQQRSKSLLQLLIISRLDDRFCNTPSGDLRRSYLVSCLPLPKGEENDIIVISLVRSNRCALVQILHAVRVSHAGTWSRYFATDGP